MAEYLWQVGMEKGSRRPLDLLRCPLGRKGAADFPPLRVCQVNVTRITRKVVKILNLVFGNLSFFSGRYTVTVCSHMEPCPKLGSPNWTLESKS